MGVGFTITIENKAVDLFLNRLAEGLSDFRPFWVHYFAPQFFDDIQRNFDSGGRYVGGWRALSPGYAAWKLARYGARPILVATGEMRESLRIGGRGNVLKSGRDRVEIGSTNRKVRYHQEGIGVPVRQVIFMRNVPQYQRLLRQFLSDTRDDAINPAAGRVKKVS